MSRLTQAGLLMIEKVIVCSSDEVDEMIGAAQSSDAIVEFKDLGWANVLRLSDGTILISSPESTGCVIRA